MRNAILPLVVFIVAFASASRSNAVCFEPTLERAFDKSAMVFSGIALRSEEIEPGVDRQYPSGAVAWTFRVGQLWKGEVLAEVVVLTRRDQFFYSFMQGVHYVVYASLDPLGGGLHIAPCSRSTRMKWAIPERHSLGTPVVVDEELRLLPVSDEELESFDGYDGRYIDARPDPE